MEDMKLSDINKCINFTWQPRQTRGLLSKERSQRAMGEWMQPSLPILVVDDDLLSRAVVLKYLAKAGFEVVVASNGKEALALFDQQFCPIVLTDWMMPEVDGPQLCRLIRQKKQMDMSISS